MKLPLITAHSGCEQTPRDSMESVECAISLGADAVELDVRRSAEGRLYIAHDRQYGGSVLEKVPLKSAFERIKNTNLRLNCDIKESFALCETLDMAKCYGFGPDRLILTGAVSPEQLAMEPTITERASVHLNIEEVLKFLFMGKLYADRNEMQFPAVITDAKLFVLGMLKEEGCIAALIRMLRALKVSGVNMPHIVLTEEMAKALREEEIFCSVWTVNELADMNRCFELLVGNITTRAVRVAIAQRTAYNPKNCPHVAATSEASAPLSQLSS